MTVCQHDSKATLQWKLQRICLLLFATGFQVMPLLAVQNKHEVCVDATQTAVSQDNGKKSLSSKVRCQVAVLCCTKQCCTMGNLHLGVPIYSRPRGPA